MDTFHEQESSVPSPWMDLYGQPKQVAYEAGTGVMAIVEVEVPEAVSRQVGSDSSRPYVCNLRV